MQKIFLGFMKNDYPELNDIDCTFISDEPFDMGVFKISNSASEKFGAFWARMKIFVKNGIQENSETRE